MIKIIWGITEVIGSNPVGASEFILGFICNCLSSQLRRSLSLLENSNLAVTHYSTHSFQSLVRGLMTVGLGGERENKGVVQRGIISAPRGGGKTHPRSGIVTGETKEMAAHKTSGEGKHQPLDAVKVNVLIQKCHIFNQIFKGPLDVFVFSFSRKG